MATQVPITGEFADFADALAPVTCVPTSDASTKQDASEGGTFLDSLPSDALWRISLSLDLLSVRQLGLCIKGGVGLPLKLYRPIGHVSDYYDGKLGGDEGILVYPHQDNDYPKFHGKAFRGPAMALSKQVPSRFILLTARLTSVTQFTLPAVCNSIKEYITQLDLSWCHQLKDASPLGACRALALLDMSYCTNLTDVSGLSDCVCLGTLCLRGCEKLQHVPLENCPSLKLCSLHECVGLISAPAIPSLERLDLGACPQLQDVSGLAHCPKLCQLTLAGCHELEDISPLICCPQLERLRLSYCFALTDIEALGGCHELLYLSLQSCQGLTDVSALANCRKLQKLFLQDCSEICDDSVHAIVGAVQQVNDHPPSTHPAHPTHTHTHPHTHTHTHTRTHPHTVPLHTIFSDPRAVLVSSQLRTHCQHSDFSLAPTSPWTSSTLLTV
jgi:Leucine-rich repeat (LRR) protein